MHTKDMLANALREAGLDAMADKTATGYYHDFLSSLDLPELQLVTELPRPGVGAQCGLGGRVGAATGEAAQGGDCAGQDNRRAVVQKRQRLLHSEQHAPGIRVEIVVEALDGDIGELHAVDATDIGDHHVELAAVRSNLGVEAANGPLRVQRSWSCFVMIANPIF
jgi:hypothetical protein